jgi:hypothetical protein
MKTLKVAVMNEETEAVIADEGFEGLDNMDYYDKKIKVSEYEISKSGMLALASDVVEYGSYMELTNEEYETLRA